MKTYPSSKPYLALPEKKEGRNYLDTFARKGDGEGSWRALGRVDVWLITCIIKDKNERDSELLIVLKSGVARSGIFITSVSPAHTVRGGGRRI